MNADGHLELVVQLSDGSVHCYSTLSASLLWQRQLPRPSVTLDLRLVDLEDDLGLVVATADDGLVMSIRSTSRDS